ncbi:MAG TPA: MFS transporter [Roseiflexaceae bacterium]|nr:MFS transporter [Roseiflexaceae bacterium]
MTLSDHDRRRGLNALLVYTFFMVIGFTMIMPLVAVHFVNNIGMAAAAVGLALAVRQMAQQGLAIVGGALSDRFGARRLICLGVLLRALGFASLAWAANLPMLFVAMVLSALGGALFEVPYQASIAALTTEETRPRYYSLSNLVSGVATTFGPLVGVALLRFDFQIVCLVAAACFALNFVIALVLLPPIEPAAQERSLGNGLGMVLRDRPFVLLTALMMGYWFTSVQINISFPLLAEQLTGSPDSVGVMFALNAGMTVLFQYPLIRLLERWLTFRQILVLGVVVMALGAGAVGLARSFEAFLACVAVFALGALLTRPTQQTLTASMANPQALGTFIGFSSLALAIGGGLGNVVGGWLVDLARAQGLPGLPWLVFCAVGLLSALGLFLLTRPQPQPLPAEQAAQAAG